MQGHLVAAHRPVSLGLVIAAAAAGAVAGCDKVRLPGVDGGQLCVTNAVFNTDPNRKLDALFVVDDSPGMLGMQAKLAEAFPMLMAAFVDRTWGGYPDLHVAVVPSSMGGGRYANVLGCETGSAGARDGAFSHPVGAGLAPGETFMRLNGGALNFSGDPGTVFAALASVGVAGCPYPQPLQATRRALTRAQDRSDRDNAGFLRADATLFVVIVTNQDDCSVPADSGLFDPSQRRLEDPYGGRGTYRCAEFGLLCEGVKPPHALSADAGDLALDACVPAEAAGRLTSIAELAADLKSLKNDPDEVLVSVIGGPADPVAVGRQVVDLGGGVTESQPRLQPSCAGAGGEAATPSVRLKAWADEFAANGLFLPACVPADSLSEALKAAGTRVPIYEPKCVPGFPVPAQSGAPNCVVTQTSIGEDGTQSRLVLPACDIDRRVVPCWNLAFEPGCWTGYPLFTVCRDASCSSRLDLIPNASLDVRCEVPCR